jgi:hypothetical protein
MNKACTIHFHHDVESILSALPQRYQENSVKSVKQGVVSSLSVEVGHAFYIDYAPDILRTRIGGRGADPVDFHMSSIAFIEWYDDEAEK